LYIEEKFEEKTKW